MIRKESGQSLVEFAIVLPFFLLLVVGVIDFGKVMYTNMQMEMVTQEATRLAGLGQSDGTVEAYAKGQFQGDASKLMVTISPDDGNRISGKYVTVTLAYPTEFFDILGEFALPLSLETSSTIRVE